MENKAVCNAVIVAGGSGSRMGTQTKKQFLILDDAPILVHTIRNISRSDYINEIIVVAPEDEIGETEKIS